MGSGDIAVPVIDKLYLSNCFELVGICTQEDKPAGRKKELTPTPVGIWAKNRGLQVDKPSSINTDNFTSDIRELKPDVIVVVSFGQILKQPLLNIPKIGCINIHASLLPKYRGASPIAAAILNGDGETGVCFMQMERGLDSGPVFRELGFPLKGIETSESLEFDLGRLSADNAEEILSEICTGKLKPIQQDPSKVSIVGKIKKTDGLIDWNKPASDIERMTRAYQPWPGAYTFLKAIKGTKKIIITSASLLEVSHFSPGRVLRADSGGFEIGAASNTVLKVLRLIPEGKKEMNSEEFLRGTKVEVGSECTNV